MTRIVNGCTRWVFLLAGLLLPCAAWSQAIEDPPEAVPRGYQAPTRAEWEAAGLDPDEYATAVRYEVPLAEWKKMDASRRARQIAGWSCIAVGLLTPAIEATVIYGGDVDPSMHPEQEVFIMISVAAGATVLTGLVLLLSAPGPEDFKQAWMRRSSQASMYLAPAAGGLGFGFRF